MITGHIMHYLLQFHAFLSECIQLCINRSVLNYEKLSIPLRLRGVFKEKK